MTRCAARHREEKGQPWLDCPEEADMVLVHGPHVKTYCRKDADRFVEAFPRGTFMVLTIQKEENGNDGPQDGA